jgi:hypothetical protein
VHSSVCLFAGELTSFLFSCVVCFKAYDLHNCGFIHKHELMAMIKGVYKRVYGSIEGVEDFVDMCYMNLDRYKCFCVQKEEQSQLSCIREIPVSLSLHFFLTFYF